MKTHLRTSHPKKTTTTTNNQIPSIKPVFQPTCGVVQKRQARDSTGNQVNQGLKRCPFVGVFRQGEAEECRS